MEEPDYRNDPNKYQKFKKVDGATYRRVNQFLRKHTHITAREWAIARLCADFRTTSGSEMTFIGENLPDLCPFMVTPTPAAHQAKFIQKVKKAGAVLLRCHVRLLHCRRTRRDLLRQAKSPVPAGGRRMSLTIDDEIETDRIAGDAERTGGVVILKTRPGQEENGNPSATPPEW